MQQLLFTWLSPRSNRKSFTNKKKVAAEDNEKINTNNMDAELVP